MSLAEVCLQLKNKTPCVIFAPPVIQWRKIRAYHLLCRQEIYELVSNQAEASAYPPQSLESFFSELEPYFQAICDFFSLKASDICYDSLHSFLVCTKPRDDGTLGLSYLEQLMGFDYTTNEPIEPPKRSTGDSILDVTTQIALVFKHQSPWFLENFSVDDCAKMATLAGQLMQDANDADDAAIKPTTFEDIGEEVLDPEFLLRGPSILTQLKENGIYPPSAFLGKLEK